MRKSTLNEKRRNTFIILFLLITTFVLYLFDRHYRDLSVPMSIILMLGIVVYDIQRFSLKQKTLPPAETSGEPRIIEHVQKEVLEAMEQVNLSALGTEYRKREMEAFESTIDDILDVCMQAVRTHLDCYTIAVFFPDRYGDYYLRRVISHDEYINNKAVLERGVGIIGSLLKESIKPLRLNDIVNDSQTLYYYQKDAGIRSVMISPLTFNNVDRGFMIVDSTEKEHFSEADHAYLISMAQLCCQVVYYAYLYNQHRLDHVRLSAMSRTEKYFFQEHSSTVVLDKLVEIIPFAFHCDRLSISLTDKESHTASVKKVWGNHADELSNLTFSLKEKSIVAVSYNKKICIFRNFSEDHYEIRYNKDEPQSTEFNSFIVIPFGVDENIGMILLESYYKNTYSENTRTLLARLISSAAVAIEKIQLLKQTENMAIHDGLTNLYNHRHLQQLLKENITRSLRYKTPVSFVIGDIDHFKQVNDTYGHRFGDTVLKTIASKLQTSIREGIDTAARYGGEEFALILAETNAVQARETVERIRLQIASLEFQTPLGRKISCTMSFGICAYGIHVRNQEQLIRYADKALYRAKTNGRDRVELYYEHKQS